MKERRIDLRTQKTYNALFQAFEELLKEKSFEQITVRELCNKANTRTATFYNHFSDKYDFFSFMIRELRNEFTDKAEILSTTESPEAFYIEYLKIGFEFIEENQQMVSALESDTLLMTMLNTSTDTIIEIIKEHIKEDHKKGYHFPADDEIMTQLLLGAMTQCGKYWFQNRKTVKKEYVFEQFKNIIHTLYQTKIDEKMPASSVK